jgi:hypothetical protein
MEANGHTFAAFHYKRAKNFTFTMAQPSDYQKSCADHPWFAKITSTQTVKSNFQ